MMKLHHFVIVGALAVLLGGGLLPALAQHGTASDPEVHFNKMAEHLELTDSQREALAAPFGEAFEILQQLHQLHDVIAAELNDEQKASLASMLHSMLGGGSHESHGEARHEAHPDNSN